MKSGKWNKKINVFDFINLNYREYRGDSSFLTTPTMKTRNVWTKCKKLLSLELENHVLDIETKTFSGINNFKPGYIDKENEVIVGLQTDKPLKRIVNPYGGIRLALKELDMYGYNMDKTLLSNFKEHRRTHNDGVFSVYTDEIKKIRHNGLLTGLPDAYGRGRIIGDYRRVALYGIDTLIETKKSTLKNKYKDIFNEETIRIREELSLQIDALNEIKTMAKSYGFDISKPATNAFEAVQWLYFGYLAAIKENNGAAMSLGRIDAFLDIYIERDLKKGILDEKKAQELIDQLVIKLRLVRHLRTKEYDELFSGDPTWVTCAIGGLNQDGRSLVTKTSYRILNTLKNLDPSPEPNLTVLWSEQLPENFKKYTTKLTIETNAIQYENDDLMRPIYGPDYAIACCVSALKVGRDMQFFGARANLAKALLYAINGGVDEISHEVVLDGIKPIKDEYLKYDIVEKNLKLVLSKLAKTYVDTMNIIHYMHDKYAYEASQMALHDTNVTRYMAYGIAGLSVLVDSLSAIKYAKVKTIRDDSGIATDFMVIGSFPKYGNDIDDVDQIAIYYTKFFKDELAKHQHYRNSIVTVSVLTITSNVVYGRHTGSTPDGRKAYTPFAPGANPMHGRDTFGALASLNSVAKLDYKYSCRDGISNTFSIVPNSLGKTKEDQISNLISLLDGYFIKGGQHLNVNVLNRELLIDASKHPERYPLLTIRVSGYAVLFNRLTKEQQEEVIGRTFHTRL